jgi:hypothetical protein
MIADVEIRYAGRVIEETQLLWPPQPGFDRRCGMNAGIGAWFIALAAIASLIAERIAGRLAYLDFPGRRGLRARDFQTCG